MAALVTEWADGAPLIPVAIIALALAFAAATVWRPAWLIELSFFVVAGVLIWVPLHSMGMV